MKLARTLLSPIAALGSVLFKGPGKPPAAIRPATRDDAARNTEMLDDLARRRGGAADVLTGRGGAEAGSAGAGKSVLG